MEELGKARRATDGNTIRLSLLACWITQVTDKHSEYVIIIAFPQQQWLREHTHTPQYYVTYTVHCLSC